MLLSVAVIIHHSIGFCGNNLVRPLMDELFRCLSSAWGRHVVDSPNMRVDTMMTWKSVPHFSWAPMGALYVFISNLRQQNRFSFSISTIPSRCCGFYTNIRNSAIHKEISNAISIFIWARPSNSFLISAAESPVDAEVAFWKADIALSQVPKLEYCFCLALKFIGHSKVYKSSSEVCDGHVELSSSQQVPWRSMFHCGMASMPHIYVEPRILGSKLTTA